ncbi:MAG: hypothetical protein R3A45_01210 [Bdellovibrionota bacterium]
MSTKLPVYRQQQTISVLQNAAQENLTHSVFVDQYIDFFSTRLRSNSESIEEYIELANLFRHKGKYKKAFTLHRNLLARPQINKKLKAMILAEMGFDYLYSKTKDFGEHFFAQSLDLQRKNAYALEGLYQCFRQQKKYPQALTTLKKLLQFTPDKRDQFNVVYAEMVMLHLQEGDLVQAQKWYKKATQYGKSALLDLMHVQLVCKTNH